MNDEINSAPSFEEPKKNNTPLIIGIIVAVILCCCCIAAGFIAWTYGDQIIDALDLALHVGPQLLL